MTWVTTGTISATPGSSVVTGSGTAWRTHLVQPGWALQAGGIQSEIADVVSETELRLARPYAGAAVSGAEYQIIQIASVAQPLINAVRDQITSVQGHLDGPLAGRFSSGSQAEPGIAFKDAPSTGWRLNSAGDLVMTIGGIDVAVVGLDQNLAMGGLAARTRLHVQKLVEFDPANAVQSATAFLQGGSRSALGAFGGALALSKPNSTRPGVVLAAKQTSGDSDQIGLSVLVHGSASSNEATQEVLTVGHNGYLGLGTGSPLARLHVHEPSSFASEIRLSNSEGHARIIQDNFGNVALNQNGHLSTLFEEYGRLDVYGDTTNNNHKLGVFIPNLGYTNDTFRLVHNQPGSPSFSFLRCVSNDANSGDVELIIRGNGDVAMDGAVSSGGADYAEFFEWADGNLAGEDRRGLSVVLVGDKIRPSEAGEVPFGVISANPSVVGDADIDRWMYKYLTDDFGSPILEDYEIVDWDETDPETGKTKHLQFMADVLPEGVTVPQGATRTWRERRVLNPEWDPDHKYVPRRDRAEWDYVGLMGKLRLRQGQPVAPGWIKMRDVSDAVEEWLVR